MQKLKFNQFSDDFQDKIQDFLKELDTPGLPHAQDETFEQRFADKHHHASGGMKKVCMVNDSRTLRPVALAEIKETKSDSEESIERFVREARITASLEHPNIVPVYDIGNNEDGKPYFIMKFLKDQSLRKILDELANKNPDFTNKYNQNLLIEVFLKVCEAVAFAHSRKVVHLDLKPDNIMIGDYGEVYVCDWGLAKILDKPERKAIDEQHLDPTEFNAITLDGHVKGTPGFMAPEQIDSKFGEKDEVTDVYALGALLYCLMTFKAPYFGSPNRQILYETLQNSPQPIENISNFPLTQGIIAICNKAMSKKKSERYQSVEELITDIRSFQTGFSTDAENADFLTIFKLFYQRNKFRMNLVFSMITLLIVVILFAFTRIKQSENLAVASSKEAKKSEAKALLAEKKAQDNLNKLRKQQNVMKKISRAAAIQLRNEADEKYNEKDFKGAFSSVKSALSLYQGDPVAWDILGQLHFSVLEFDEAIAAFKKSRDLFTGFEKPILQRYIDCSKDLKKLPAITSDEKSIKEVIKVMDKYNLKQIRTIYNFIILRLKSGNLSNDPIEEEPESLYYQLRLQ